MIDQMPEHEEIKKTESQKEIFEPTPEERKLSKKVMGMFERFKKYRSKYDQDWLSNYKFFRGKQWESARPSYRHSEVINFVFQQIQSMVPILTDKQPRMNFVPTEPQDIELSKILNEIVNYDWNKYGWNMSVIEALYDSHIYGTGFGYVGGKVEDGKGKICFESADPFYCFPDPSAKGLQKDYAGNAFIHAEPLDIVELKRKYPKFSKYIKSDLHDLMNGDKTDLGNARFTAPSDKYTGSDYETNTSKSSDDKALEITAWFRDDEVEESQNEEGNFVQKKKYPQGRKVVVVNNMIMEDLPYPYEDFVDRFCPYARLQNYVLPREFYGISEIEQLKGPQKIFNKLVSFALDVLTLMGNPIWVVDTTAGIDTDGLTSRPGLIIEKEPNSEVRRVEGVQLQPFVMSMIDRLQTWFNDISGSSDVSRGQKPEGVTAASAIKALQDSSLTRVRLKARLLDMFLQEVGQMYLSRVFQFYTAPQIFRITNNDKSNEYFKFSVSEQADEYGNTKKVFKIKPIIQVGNEAVEGDEMVMKTDGKFDVIVDSGSSLPFAKMEKMDMAFQLFDRQVLDAQGLLEDIDYPNKETLLARLQEKQAQAAQIQAQQPPQQG